MMKYSILLVLCAFVTFTSAFAADEAPDCSKNEEFMKMNYTRDQGDICIKEWQTKVNDLKAKLEAATAATQKSEAELTRVTTAVADCNKDLYRLIGATDADVNAFKERLGRLEASIREMKALSDDVLADRQDKVKMLEEEWNQLKQIKISILPEFYNRVVQAGRDIKGLYRQKKTKEYIVQTWAKERDCLWTISGKQEIYADPFQWPKIWQANTDQIRNPDIIHPGQRLLIPPAGEKTSEEMKAERSYWRKKRAAMKANEEQAAMTPAETPAATPTPAAPKSGK